MEITQYFTGRGILGAVFFVVGPFVSWFGWLASGPTPSDLHMLLSPSTFSFIAIVGTLITLASVPMMIVGRSYSVPKDRITRDQPR